MSPMNMPVDKRALKILLDAFWSPSRLEPPRSFARSFAYAKSKGIMFDPAKLDHQRVLNELLVAIRKLDRRRPG